MTTRTADRPATEGGVPVRDPVKRPWPSWPIFAEEEERALLRVVRSGHWWYVGGPECAAIERDFAQFQGVAHAVTCTNGTAALEIALRALKLEHGDEVIVPPYTFIATASSVLSVGAIPVFADIQPDTLNIDPVRIEEAITSRTRAIIAVHMAGRPADMDAICEVAGRHGLAVIEDAAQAHGASWRGRGAGSIGDLGCFSFQAGKNLNCGDGGMVVSDSGERADAAWSVMNVGRSRDGAWYEHNVLGSNFRMTEFQAAILRAQITRLPEQIDRRTANAAALTSMLTEADAVRLMAEDPRVTCHANHLFVFRLRLAQLAGRTSADFARAVTAEGVPVSTGYVPLYKEKLFRSAGAVCPSGRQIAYDQLSLPVCEEVCTDTIWLNQNFLLGSREDTEDIAAAIIKVAQAWSANA